MLWLVYTAPIWITGLLIFLPALLEVHVERREQIQGKAVFTLGMGLTGVAVHTEGEGLRISILFFKRSLIRLKPKRKAKEKPEKKKKAKPVPEAPGEKEKKRRPRDIWKKVQTAKTLFDRYEEPALRSLRSIFRAFHLRDLGLYLEIGLEDPAQTGLLAGWVYALRHLTGKRVRLNLTPNFTEQCLRGTARLRLRVALYCIVWAVLRLTVDVAPDLIRSYLLPKLRWPKRTPVALAHPEASG